MSETTTKQLKKFRLVTKDHDEVCEYKTARAAVIDAMQASAAGPTKLYRVLDDGTEVLLFDSQKCRRMSVEDIFAKAEKGGRT